MDIVNLTEPRDNELPLSIISPKIFKDERGYFFESFNQKEFEEKIGKIDFVQDNESKSSFGVLRGFHYQRVPYEQAKLVRVIEGAVLDVAVDIREFSPTFGQYWFAFLSGENKRQFFIPRGFAHAFLCLRDNTIFAYKCDNVYNKESEGGIMYNDKTIAFPWGNFIDVNKIILSEKDKVHPNLG